MTRLSASMKDRLLRLTAGWTPLSHQPSLAHSGLPLRRGLGPSHEIKQERSQPDRVLANPVAGRKAGKLDLRIARGQVGGELVERLTAELDSAEADAHVAVRACWVHLA